METSRARELAVVLRTLKDERVRSAPRTAEGHAATDDTTIMLSEAQRHFEDLASEPAE